MSSTTSAKPAVCHIVAMPYPGRGHTNPLMNLCIALASKSDDIPISFVLTEEWLSLIGSDKKPDKVRFRSLPNVIPSELVRASDMIGFLNAVWTKMEAPFEQILDELERPPTLIIADTHLFWAVSVGNRRNIPVASFWPMSSAMFSVFHHFHLFQEKDHFPVDLLDKENEQVDYIPGVSSTRLMDLPGFNGGIYPLIMKQILGCIWWVGKATYLLLPSIYELESQTIESLKTELSLSIYSVGPSIPYLNLNSGDDKADYLQWLDKQPSNSVLYVSMGSFLSVSSVQMEEIKAGLKDSGVRFLLVARDGIIDGRCRGEEGFVVPWCDQLRVLCHSSVGGFWSHCGWNSVREGVFAGVPFLTFPLFADQNMNSKLIVEDWKIGWRLNKHHSSTENLARSGDISILVKKLMDLGSDDDEVKQMRRSAKELQEKCLRAIGRHGSSEININSFIRSI